MATRAYIVNVIDENSAEMIYNHFDGGEYLNKALNSYKIDPDDIFGIGDIRAINLETGDIERYEEGGPISIIGKNLSDTLNQIVGEAENVNYLQVLDPKTNEWVMIKKNNRTLVNLLDIYEHLKKEDIKENYESKWKKFINENQQFDGFTDNETDDFNEVISNIKFILRNEDDFEVKTYLDSVKNDFYRDFYAAIDEYYDLNDREIIDDFENYIIDKRDS